MMNIPSRDIAEERDDEDAANLDPHRLLNDAGEKMLFLFISVIKRVE